MKKVLVSKMYDTALYAFQWGGADVFLPGAKVKEMLPGDLELVLDGVFQPLDSDDIEYLFYEEDENGLVYLLTEEEEAKMRKQLGD